MDVNDKNVAPPSYAEVTGHSSWGQPPPPQPPGFVQQQYVPPPSTQNFPQTHQLAEQRFPVGYITQPYQQQTTNMTTIIVTNAANVDIFRMSSRPVNALCPGCGMQIVTQVSTTAGALAFLICTLLALFGFWLGCCLIPFCINECMDVEHYCPNCKRLLGVCRRL